MRLILLVGIECRLADNALVEVAVREVIQSLVILFGYIRSCPVSTYFMSFSFFPLFSLECVNRCFFRFTNCE